ncbi:hypothetical protein DdX_03514 [Ditylenchus destructor]|uniref:Uncharacterized protein n=1 Tax=Ditylenchus destructor TaxID=166010 RepID=A0AAD4NFI4_9BILA|nr:hypothetical protein DdX_03514 [Ditylenchus destructor]
MVVFIIIVVVGALLSTAGCCRRRQLNISANMAKQPENRGTETNTETRTKSGNEPRSMNPPPLELMAVKYFQDEF